jgi:O-antigen/teichoic acid export membrane protein
MALQRSDIVLLAALRGPKDAAVYAAATRFLVLGQLGSGAISTTIQPKLAHLLAKDDREAARTVYRVATVWLVLMAWPIYLVSAVFSRQLLHLFGRGYAVGAAVIVILSLTMLVATATGNVDVVLAMAGRPTWTMVNAFCALGLNLALNLFLIPRWGIFGAAVAWAAALLFNSLTPLTQLALSMGLHPFGRSSALAAALTGTCFGALPFLARLVSGGSVAVGVAAVVIGAGLYFAGLWHWRRAFDLASLASVRRRGGRSPAGQPTAGQPTAGQPPEAGRSRR